MKERCERCGIELNSLIDYPDITVRVDREIVKMNLCCDCLKELQHIVNKFVKKGARK